MFHIIINPASRSGAGKKLWKSIVEPYLMEQKIEYISYFSKHPGDVAALAAQITNGASVSAPRKLIILGGDGTVNEALQGIQDFRAVTLGYIPTGSSNDFARDLELPKDTLEAVKRVFEHGTTHKMDVGCVSFADGTQRYFAVSCGMGFDAAVCEETNRSAFKKTLNHIRLGKLAYLSIAIKQLFIARSASCTITLDDKPAFTINKYLFSASMLHRYEGGGFKFCPNAKSDDGIIDICTAATKMPKLLILLILPTAFWGKHYLFPGITPYKAKNIHIKASAPLWIHTDGEILRKDDELSISCQRRVLTVIY
ncbi:MAG: diacylglycerol kinase family lipid kinase [Lachnospiraceae bacterium]|nr:diacylglycerol kinase family lipid kinase [Lachnospiraceae bacterium]